MNRIWGKVSKVIGGLFLFAGGTVSAGLLVGIVVSQATGGILTFLMILMVFLGLAPASLGAWLLHVSSRAERQAIRAQFFQLLRAKHGRLSLLDFAATTHMEPTIARRQLDAWATEFSASFEVSDGGDVYYIFSTEPLTLPESNGLSQSFRQWLQSEI